MTRGHERLDVYRLSIGSVVRVVEKAKGLNEVHRPARDQWLRASQSIPLNIAEGNGKIAEADRRQYFEIARGSMGIWCEISLPIPIAISIWTENPRAQTGEDLQRE